MKSVFREHDNYLEVTVTEEYSFSELCSLIDRTAVEARKHGKTRILADLTRITGEPGMMERFDLGVKAADVLCPPYKTLVLAEKRKINKFGEDVAINRGAFLLSTSQREAGMSWLLNPELVTPRVGR